ncbi:MULTISPECIES: hypothetical protein [Streptomyces]|uniref:hypothetical protein n=1 Tax=Streptomyces TaxID=1883 RepID=UPI0036583E0E
MAKYFKGQCSTGHPPRDLSKFHPEPRLPEDPLNIPYEKPYEWMEHAKKPIKPIEVPPELAVVETDEGEYDFGFGRPAPKVVPPEPDPAETAQRIKEAMYGVVPPDEAGLMARTIYVLIQKLGEKVPLDFTEMRYIIDGTDRPVPEIAREETVMGSQFYIHTKIYE